MLWRRRSCPGREGGKGNSMPKGPDMVKPVHMEWREDLRAKGMTQQCWKVRTTFVF